MPISCCLIFFIYPLSLLKLILLLTILCVFEYTILSMPHLCSFLRVNVDADQAAKYKNACDTDSNQTWDCTMWSRFGTDFAYVQTGIYDYMNSGTTLAISKKGSGLANILNPCIEAFIKTKSYKDLCTKYGLEGDCFQNEFFDVKNEVKMPYSKPANELNTSCSDGYCPCI